LRESARGALIVFFLFGLICCTSGGDKLRFHFDHGARYPDLQVSVLSWTPKEIVFRIKSQFIDGVLYHFILDGGQPISQKWFPTFSRYHTRSLTYYVTLEAKRGFEFRAGKTYTLCIGRQSLEEANIRQPYYRCLVDETFVLPAE
jgi:hypothetical protein